MKIKEHDFMREVMGPNNSLAIQGYTNQLLVDNKLDPIFDDEEVYPEDVWVDFITTKLVLKPMPAFLCVLAYQNSQVLYEAVYSFIIRNEYQDLLKFLASRLRLSDYEMLAEDCFDTYDEQELRVMYRLV